MVDGRTKVPILICVDQIVDGLSFNNLIKMIMNFMMKGGRLSKEELSKKLLCSRADGMNVFQGGKTKVTKQIKDSWAPFSMGVHCVAHHTNLAMQSLGDLTFIAKIESFMLNMYGYFNHSPKRHMKFQRLVQTLKTKGNKILKNVKTRWMSMLDLLNMIMAEYRPSLAVMQIDCFIIHVAKVILFP
jgi:hypothetical protein